MKASTLWFLNPPIVTPTNTISSSVKMAVANGLPSRLMVSGPASFVIGMRRYAMRLPRPTTGPARS